MSRRTTTVYVCDSCLKEFAKAKDIHKLVVQYRRRDWSEVEADMCADCQTAFLIAAGEFFGDVSELRRDDAR